MVMPFPQDVAEAGEDHLEHFGIKGMKWGVRKRSSSGSNASDDYKLASTLKSKSASELSNSEMKTLIDRMNLEQQYSKLMAVAPKPTKSSAIKKFVTGLLIEVGKQEISRVARGTASVRVEQALMKSSNVDIAKRITPKKQDTGGDKDKMNSLLGLGKKKTKAKDKSTDTDDDD